MKLLRALSIVLVIAFLAISCGGGVDGNNALEVSKVISPEDGVIEIGDSNNDGYEPYIGSFSIRDEEYEIIPNPDFLEKSEDIENVKDSLGKDQYKRQDLKEVKEKVNNSLEEIAEPTNESPLLKVKDYVQKIKQNNDTIEVSLNKYSKNIVRTMSFKKIDTTNKFISNLKVNSKYASKTIYTIQIGSHTKKAAAEEEFNSILQALNRKEHDYLRIEKIGKYYALRLGKFDNYDNTEKFHKIIKQRLSAAMILKAYIKNERIIKFYE